MAIRGHLCDIIVKRRWRIPAKDRLCLQKNDHKNLSMFISKGRDNGRLHMSKKNHPFLFERLLKVIPFCLLLHLHPLYFVSAFQFEINSGVAGAEFQIFNVIFKISPHHNLIHTLQFIYSEDFQIKYIAPSSWVGFLIVAIINNHGRV